jgi:hypothetical protein
MRMRETGYSRLLLRPQHDARTHELCMMGLGGRWGIDFSIYNLISYQLTWEGQARRGIYS